jgi:hypothetical protein
MSYGLGTTPLEALCWSNLPPPRYGEWRKVLQLSEPPQDARGGGAHGGPQYSQVGREGACAFVHQAASVMPPICCVHTCLRIYEYIQPLKPFQLRLTRVAHTRQNGSRPPHSLAPAAHPFIVILSCPSSCIPGGP